MILFKKNIENIDEYQRGTLPDNAENLTASESTDEIMKKSMPIAVILCIFVSAVMFIKIYVSSSVVVSPIALLSGVLIGFALLIVHEWLHAIVFPRKAEVTIGKLKGKLVFVALASYPMKRKRFIFMSILPFILGIIPLLIFICSSPESIVLNGLMFGMACMGMVSPYPDIYNVILVLKKTQKNDEIMFYKDDLYCIPNYIEE